MALMIISLVLWVLILFYNAVYSFLPSNVQSSKWVKTTAIAAAIIILIGGVAQAIQEYRGYRFAYVRSADGSILKSKNFPWRVTKSATKEGPIVYIANERFGDASEVTVKLDKPVEYQVYNAIDGVGVKFFGSEEDIPNFKIIIKD